MPVHKYKDQEAAGQDTPRRPEAEAECRPLTGATAWYRDIRANMQQTWKPGGLDHCGKMITIRA